jgi:hypothetical protein
MISPVVDRGLLEGGECRDVPAAQASSEVHVVVSRIGRWTVTFCMAFVLGTLVGPVLSAQLLPVALAPGDTLPITCPTRMNRVTDPAHTVWTVRCKGQKVIGSPTPTAIATATATGSPTATASPTATPSATPTPAASRTPSPSASPTSTAAPGSSVLVGAGDIANCSLTGDEETAKLLDGIAGTIFTAGDNVYADGTSAQFASCYDPSWGRHSARTRPAPGNHDYHTPGASGYFGYFGPNAGPAGLGYYAFDLGAWRVYSLNSEVISDAEIAWLRADLAANPRSCIAAYWHHPRYATLDANGSHGSNAQVEPLWDAVADAGADLVLNGHSHHYERFAPNRGVTEVVVGTGGTGLNGFATTILAGSQARNATAHGVLKLTLTASGFTGEFVPVAGQTFTDTFSGSC